MTYTAKPEHHRAMAKFHLAAAEFFRKEGKTADAEAAQRLADAADTTLYFKHGTRKVAVASVEEAAQKWVEFRDRTMAGVSQIGNGGTVVRAGTVIARISYNGRTEIIAAI